MDKGYWIFMIALVIAMGAGMAVEKYQKGQCQTEAVKRGMSGDEVAKACK